MSRQRPDLLYFLNTVATAESKRTFAENWPYLRLALIQSQQNVPRIWPYNVALALRCTLVRCDAQVYSGQIPAEADDNLDQLLRTLDDLSRSMSQRLGNDTPPELQTTWASLLLKDAYAFPNDSAVYRNWKALSDVITTIDKAISNLEKHTRSLSLQNDSLLAQIKQVDSYSYVQERFVEKFQLGRNAIAQHVLDEMARINTKKES